SGGGNDTLQYTTSDDVTVNLLSGAATGFSLTRGLVNVTSDAGDDSLTGNSLDNALTAGAGNDLLRGGFGNDTLQGGADDDLLYGEAGDDLRLGGPGAGNDRLDGGAGIDTVSYADATAAVNVTLATFEVQDTGGAGTDRIVDVENLTGSAHDDVLTGNQQA